MGGGRKKEREKEITALQLCEAQALLKGNVLGIKWYEMCQI